MSAMAVDFAGDTTALLAESEDDPQHQNGYGSLLADGPADFVAATGAVRTQVYGKRWYILAVFSFLGLFQGMIWNTFGPISASVLTVFCPNWSPATLALFGNWGNIMYIVPIVPVLWCFELKGLRFSMIMTAVIMTIGAMLRCLPVKIDTFTVMCHLCAVLNGIAGIIVFSAPSAVSSAWFPPAERTTATGIAIVFNNLGNALSFFAGPAIVPDPPAVNGSTSSDVPPDEFILSRSRANCADIEKDEWDMITTRITILMYLVAGLVLSVTVLIMLHFPSKPKLPPSITSSIQRMDFVPGLKRICCNRNALLMTLSFSLFNGLVASWYSVMNITFSELPFGGEVDKDRIIGYIGVGAILSNSVATILVSKVVDHLKGRMKLTLLVIMTVAVSCWIWLGLICLRAIPFSLPQLYVSTICASALTYSAAPIFFEFTVELVYPVPEGIVGGFLTALYNGVGMSFLFLFYAPALATNPRWIPYAIMVSTSLSIPLLLLVKEQYNRSAIDQFQDVGGRN